jgi:hypothetical protein
VTVGLAFLFTILSIQTLNKSKKIIAVCAHGTNIYIKFVLYLKLAIWHNSTLPANAGFEIFIKKQSSQIETGNTFVPLISETGAIKIKLIL